eukprot:gb/GECH01007139.1/.p1 GENE.gb/GECH01007139.1/~~gb/GECH01007139.1/.p1  ORF type:complete len:167 (+),score=30.75 gb/GECH01007139.1/:1-501(+)
MGFEFLCAATMGKRLPPQEPLTRNNNTSNNTTTTTSSPQSSIVGRGVQKKKNSGTNVSGRPWKQPRRRASSMRYKPTGGMSVQERRAKRERLRSLKRQEEELKRAEEEKVAAKRKAEKERQWERYAKEKKAENYSMLNKLKNNKKNKLNSKHYGKVRMLREGVIKL